MHPIQSLPTPASPAPPASRDAALNKAASALESTFLAEMLKYAGAEQTPRDFGGGIGESQFASFLAQAEADAITKNGGIGLSRAIYAALKARADGQR
ncbi:MAG: rod-binding protein [Paracoccaceae bacterium]|nr:rod-binding protein [Paracoccaceae bacterium]MDE3121777.1 rod-binding protein [Paracoccaceae bacterium]MDE3237998.1 rod-binding protein [Paracoccaceae bacterium]